MTHDELTAALCAKMEAEQARYKQELLKLSPAEILEKAVKYAVREDMLFAVDDAGLSDAQLSALLRLDRPLECVYQTYLSSDYSTLQPLADSMVDRADEELRALEREQSEAKRPSVREQLRAGTAHAAPDHTGKPPVQAR